MRVLIADDHSFFRAGLESVLATNGLEVVASVGDGITALDAVAELDPDLVILDVRMPGHDGVETLRELRRQGRTCPVVLLAAEFEDEALLGAIDAGANAIVSKTNADRTLLDAITAVQSGGQFFEQGYLDRYIGLKASAAGKSGAGENESLSDRERRIAEGVAQGLRNREIALKCGLSEAMVKLYLHRIYSRLDLNNRTELALHMRERMAG